MSIQEKLTVEEYGSLDDILEKGVGFGAGHSTLIRPIHFLLFAEGCESVALGLLLPILQKQWGITNSQKSLLIACVYLGVAVGSYLATYSDRYGRLTFILIDAILTTIFGLLSCLCTEIKLFLIIRFFYGIGIGLALPLSATYLTEIVPISSRARCFTMSRVYWAIGILCTCILSWVLLVNYHWRILLFLITLPSIFAILDIVKNGRESLRYVWVRKDIQKSKQILDILTSGNGKPEIPMSTIKYLIERQNDAIVYSEDYSKIKDLFKPKYKKLSFIFIYTWAAACFISYSVLLILPTLLEKHTQLSKSKRYLFLIAISFVEIFSFYSSQYVMDHPKLGRKKALYMSNIGLALLSIFILINGQSNIFLLLLAFMGYKILGTYSFNILHPYTAQIYETLVRSTAMGIFSMCGRISTCFLGIIGINSLQWAGGLGLYIIIFFMSTLIGILIYQMPYCTTGRRLDF